MDLLRGMARDKGASGRDAGRHQHWVYPVNWVRFRVAAAVPGGCIVRIRARKEVSNGNQDVTEVFA